MAEYFDIKQIAARYGVSVRTIYNWIAEGKFPQPVSLGLRCVRWRAGDLAAWEQAIDAARGTKAAAKK